MAAAQLLGLYFTLLSILLHCNSVFGSKESILLDWLFLNGGKVRPPALARQALTSQQAGAVLGKAQ